MKDKARTLITLRLAEADAEPVDVERAFRDMLDECYSFKSVGGPFAYLAPSQVLEEMSPTDFRCGVADHSDSMELVEVDGDNYQPSDVNDAKEFVADELDSQIKDLQSEIEESSLDESLGDEDIEALKTKLSGLQDLKAAVETYTF